LISSQLSSLIDAGVRGIAMFAVGVSLVILLTHWAVRRRLLGAFGWWPRFVRSWGDPLLHPIERRLLSAGGNPQDAPLWLLGVAVVAGLLAISAERWLLGTIGLLESLRGAGLRVWLRLLVGTALSVVSLAIIIRVVASWFGVGRFTRWMRPLYLLTDWVVEPIRRLLPSFGPLDLSPLIAYLAVLLLRSLLLGML
jgi:YggT family protein